MDKTSNKALKEPKKEGRNETPDQEKSDRSFQRKHSGPSPKKPKIPLEQWTLVWLILCMATASLLYRIIVDQKLEQTSLMFIGLPAVLALCLSFIPTKSVTGLMVKGTCLFLLISGIILGEGLICVLMAAPIFLCVAVFSGFIIDFSSKKKNKGRTAVFLLILPFTFEGTHPQLSFPRHEEVTVQKTVFLQEKPENILSRRLTFTQELPLYLRMGFPAPLYVTGGDLKVGSQGCFHFSTGKKLGDICFRITRKEDNKMIFGDVRDKTPIAHWLKGKEGVIQWETNKDSGATIIKMTLIYDRLLDPAWYFGPFERYAVKLAGKYLLNSYFNTTKSATK